MSNSEERWYEAPSTTNLSAVAHHEAGHALGFIREDRPFHSITVRPVDDVLGEVRGCLNGHRSRFGEAVTSLAGPAAEMYFHMMRDESFEAGLTEAEIRAGLLLAIMTSDFPEVVEAVDAYVGDGPSHIAEAPIREAARMVVDDWPAVARLAQALVAATDDIFYEEAVRIMAPLLSDDRQRT